MERKEDTSLSIKNLIQKQNISVFGKTISIIGEFENLAVARKAIELLLSGSPHANVYKWLEKRRRDMRQQTL